MGKKMGRPPLLERDKRRERLVLLFTTSELRALESAADKAGERGASAWARGVLLSAANAPHKPG